MNGEQEAGAGWSDVEYAGLLLGLEQLELGLQNERIRFFLTLSS